MWLHLDPFNGASGDMFLGACLDLGMPPEVLQEVVDRLALPGVSISVEHARRGGIAGTRFEVLLGDRPAEEAGSEPGESEAVHEPGHGHGRGLAEIRRIIAASGLAPEVRERADVLFVRLAEAEAAVHGTSVEAVHFHEVGAEDSIVDIVGAAAALASLAPSRVTCGPVNVGSGYVDTAHGRLPVPAPATARLLAGIPVVAVGESELLTPTGAVLLAELVDEFTPLPNLQVHEVGYGLGRRELEGTPNALRIWRGAPAERRPEVVVLECEVDDVSGELLGHALERLLEAGALDVFHTPVVMKKGRPGALISVLARPGDVEHLGGVLLRETGALGCRWRSASRIEAERARS